MSEELLLYEGRNKASEVRLTLVLPSQGLLGGFVGYPLPDGLRIIQSQGEKKRGKSFIPLHTLLTKR